MFNTIYLENLAEKYENASLMWQSKKIELENLLQNMPKRIVLLAKALYAIMPITDIISLSCHDVISHAEGIAETIENFAYCADIPPEIFAHYVLPYRINNEDFRPYNKFFMHELQPYVAGKNLLDAALAVNYRCLAAASYRSTDDRTIGARTTATIGYGRCGEESVMGVAMLRSVGIPARQCYVPYWAHCDDNHAWIEVFTGNKWNYLGACEAQEFINVGWFNHAASKAPIVRHRIFGIGGNAITADENELFKTEATTEIYGKTAELLVNGKPNSKIGVYIINYGKPALICEKMADLNGIAKFTLGVGGYIIFCGSEDAYDCKALDLRFCQEITLDLTACPTSVAFDLLPPNGSLPTAPHSTSAAHFTKISEAIEHRICHMQKSNPAIDEFLSQKSLTMAQKQAVISTLTAKDLTDVSLEVLNDIATAFSFETAQNQSIFQEYILKARVENEMLMPHRAFAKEFFYGNPPQNPQEIYSYLRDNIKTHDSLCFPELYADLCAVLAHKISSTAAMPIHFVQLCRTFGFGARLNPTDKAPEYWNGDEFKTICEGDAKTAVLQLKNGTDFPITLGENATVSMLQDGGFYALSIGGILESSVQISVKQGTYAICNSARQIDGGVTGVLQFSNLQGETLLNSIQDKTLEKLKNVPIVLEKPNNTLENIFAQKCILAFTENGAEPTEHFLNELWESKPNLHEAGIFTVIIGDLSPELPSVKRLIDDGTITFCADLGEGFMADLRRKLDVGDERLPFISAISAGKALFAFANYNVGTVKTMVNILQSKANS